MSIEMQSAFEGDMAVINEDGSKNYVETDDDNFIDAEVIDAEIPPEKTEDSNNEQSDVQAALFG